VTDDRIDMLIRRLDIGFEPDPAFVSATLSALRPRAQAARVTDAGPFGRFRRALRLVVRDAATIPAVGQRRAAILVVALLAFAIVGLLIAGTLRRAISFPSGPLLLSNHGDLQAVDGPAGAHRSILPPGVAAEAVSRSPDGRLVAFWTIEGDGVSRMHVVGVDGRDERPIAGNLSLGFTNTIDTWSADSRFIATEAVVPDPSTATDRIVVVDVRTGTARVITRPGLVAQNPLWSPDGQSIAFTAVSAGIRSLAVIRLDGSDLRTLGGTVRGVSGPDTWSPDGRWIYFDANGLIYRTDVSTGRTEWLFTSDLKSGAPASSPDGSQVAFMVHRPGPAGWDLHIGNSDGSHDHLLLEFATNDGWSTDGRFILSEWTPPGLPGGLATVDPRGSSVEIVVPFPPECRMDLDPRQTCLQGVGWGEPRP
jgi:dipeptidyl aminopeptidase/acylaminoacyl peptidase